MSSSRQLAAIMFTDIVGYTALMGEDEEKAFELLRKNRQIQRPLVEKFNGKWLKEIGDGILASFTTVSDAVYCAKEIQEACQNDQNLKLRIGIHLGEVVFEGDDVFGDGVNIASRLEAAAPTGGIWVSESVERNLQNKKGIETSFVRETRLKNVKTPVKIYEVRVGGPENSIQAESLKPEASNLKKIVFASLAIIFALSIVYFLFLDQNYSIPTSQHADSDINELSIAVLPFTNMSSDKDQDYFCDGIAEDILNDLAQLEGLKVAARTSSFVFKDKNLDIREIGAKLGVTTVLEGSIQKSGNKLRITAQLINVADGYHLWSNRYDRTFEDVFDIKDEIAQNIVKALAIKLSKEDKQKLEKVNTQDVQAYDFYIRGRDYFYKGHEDKVLLSIVMFKKAIEIDEDYALAYTGMSDSYAETYMYFDKTEYNLQQALMASEKALELDPELAEAHASYGLVLSQSNQFEDAEKEFQTAISLNPRLFGAYYQYGRACRAIGKHNNAAKLFEKAVQIEPENYLSATFLVSAYSDLEMEKEKVEANQVAVNVFRRHLDLNPDDARALYLGAGCLIIANKNEEALQWMERAVAINPDEISVLYNAACIYSLLGKIDVGIDYLDRAVSAGFEFRDWIENDSDLDNIRDDARFQEILERIE